MEVSKENRIQYQQISKQMLLARCAKELFQKLEDPDFAYQMFGEQSIPEILFSLQQEAS